MSSNDLPKISSESDILDCSLVISWREILLHDNVNYLLIALEDLSSKEEILRFFQSSISLKNSWITTEDASVERDSVTFSKLLLLLFMYGARCCCKVALDRLQFEDLLSVHEESGNLLHALVIGGNRQLHSSTVFDAILTDMLERLSEEEVRRLNSASGYLGLSLIHI